jgi:putative membrane protein
MEDECIQQATFNPKVRNYFTVVWVFVSALTIVGIVFTPIVAIIVWLLSGKMLKAMSAKLQARKLVVKRGIIFVVEKSIPLEKITDVALSQGPVMRFFGLYQLSFETAGQSAQGALVSLIGVDDAHGFREAILKQKDSLSLTQNLVSNKSETSANSNAASAVDVDNVAANNISASEIAALTQSVQNIEKMLSEIVASKN